MTVIEAIVADLTDKGYHCDRVMSTEFSVPDRGLVIGLSNRVGCYIYVVPTSTFLSMLKSNVRSSVYVDFTAPDSVEQLYSLLGQP